MSSLIYNENLQCNIFTFEPSVVLKCIVNWLDQCLTLNCQLKTIKGGNKNHLLFSPPSDLMSEKLTSGLEKVNIIFVHDCRASNVAIKSFKNEIM